MRAIAAGPTGAKMSSGAAIFVTGPAGAGKSTFCNALLRHCESIGRSAHLINLDPAAEEFEFAPTKDIRELVSVEEVMEEFGLGPNGGLVYCLEFLLENLEWLEDDLGEYQDEFLIIDCPGQIELYTHYDIMPRIIYAFQKHSYQAAAVYLLESQFFQDVSKYFAGVLNATSAMMQLGIPHLNVISKMDLLDPKKDKPKVDNENEEEDDDVNDECHPLHRYFYPDPALLAEKLSAATKPKFFALNEALVQLIDEFDMVNFIPLDVRKESSLINILSHIDHATQFAEGLEPKEPKEFGDENDENDFDSFDFGSREGDRDYGLEDQD